jgi:hypothetical protein
MSFNCDDRCGLRLFGRDGFAPFWRESVIE